MRTLRDLFAALIFSTLLVPQSLAQLWVASYNGPDSTEDIPSGMVVDAAGNTYVAGISGLNRTYGMDNPMAFALAKYDIDGEFQWVHRLESLAYYVFRGWCHVPAAIGVPVVDRSGNVFLCAKNGICSNEARAVIGGEYFIQKISPDGNLLLDFSYLALDNSSSAPSLQLDGEGNIYVAGTSRVDSLYFAIREILLLKFDATGTLLWERRHGDSSPWTSETAPVALAVDSLGNAYVAGSQESDTTGADIVTMKYDTDGNLLWFTRYDHFTASPMPEHGGEVAADLRLDGLGNLYILGTTETSTICIDCPPVYPAPLLLKYDPDGNLLWDAFLSMQFANAMEFDGNDNVCIAGLNGYFESPGDPCGASGGDYAIHKYDPSGVLLWEQLYGDGDVLHDEALALDVDATGNVYVTGRTGGMPQCSNTATHSDYGTIMLDPGGNRVWSRIFAGSVANGTDVGVDVRVDAAGDVYVTGYCWDDSTMDDYVTLKYHPCGLDLMMLGDMNLDSSVTATDVIYLVNYVFKSGDPPPLCDVLGDVQCDGPVNSADIIYMVNHIFKGGPPPCAEDPCSHPLAGTCP